MAEPFIGEIRLFAFGQVPAGWVPCDGRTLQIQGNQALFSILGTTYGGNGVTTFSVPNLQGRVPLGWGQNIPLGQAAGEQTHTLTVSEMPMHMHMVAGSTSPADQVSPYGMVWAQSDLNPYSDSLNTTMNQGAVGNAGGSQVHPNMQPYMAVNYCIAVQGYFPPHN